MQSDNKSPNLSQYKNDIIAKQKLIRQRLYGESNENNSPKGSKLILEKDDIPSIDDEYVEKISQERRYKSRFSYFEDEAEASLQFFKKNLIADDEAGKAAKPSATSNLFDRPPLLNTRARNQPIYYKSGPPERNKDSSSIDKTYNTIKIDDEEDVPKKIVRPVPFKQSALTTQPKVDNFSSSRASYSGKQNSLRSNVEDSGVRAKEDVNSSYQLLDDGDNPLQRDLNQRSLPNPRIRTKPRPVSEKVKSIHHDNRSQESQEHARRPVTPEDRRSVTESPSIGGTFSRKPLYNSLLRAHDSIRLKVNRPKVRPKSEVQVPDTEVFDVIPLEELDSSKTNVNERPVDVKRGSSRRKSKKKEKEAKLAEEKLPVRNFSEVRIVKVVRNEDERSMGVTVRAEDGHIVVARIMAGSLADKQGCLKVGDIILSVNNREVYTPQQLQEELLTSIDDESVLLKIVPSFKEELPTLCIYLRALFSYDANVDSILPCKEVGISFNQGDILEVVNQEDPNWWQARRVDSEDLHTGLIPSQSLEERRRAFVIPDYDLATRTSICGTRVSRKSKKEIYNIGQNCEFDKAELQLYEEVCRTPAFERRTLVLIGANGVGKQAFKARLVTTDPDRFGTPLPHTSRLPRDGEEDGIHYHFVTRERMEEDIIEGKYLEYGEYDGALYGTKLDSIREIIGSGKVCVLDCSPTCLKVLKTSDYLPFVAFIAAPTLDQLRYMHEWARNGNKNYTTLDRALSRQSRRARTLQDFAFDFFEDEDLQFTIEESARLFRMYENYFDIVLVNNNFESTFGQLKEAIDALSMAPQWIPISWIYGT